jgi:glycosyltransferase involved in cell wall biosynthesis
MTVLVGHPTGNPNAHHAALAHLEAARLEAFCVPWMPSSTTLAALEMLPPLRSMARRLGRRAFPELADAPKVQGRLGELRRLLTRAAGRGDGALQYQANDWLMRVMARACRRPAVTAVHAYEDCSLASFVEARRLGKACIYDMPIGYHPAWTRTQAELLRRYDDWLPAAAIWSERYTRPDQKRREMELADLVLAPSAFAYETIARFHPDKPVAVASYGVDTVAWPVARRSAGVDITFLFAGPCSLRKGVPLLLDAWRAAGLKHARLQLVGSWQLVESKKRELPPRVQWADAVALDELRKHYAQADVFVLPTYFEGRALVIGEALSSGLPVLSTPASGAGDLIDADCGHLIPIGNLDALVESLRWFAGNRDRLPAMERAARAQAERCTWEGYRRSVTHAVAPFL